MFIKKWFESPFYESRKSNPIDMIILHHIGSVNNKLYSVSGTLSWFTDESVHINNSTGLIENKVSAHYVIPREVHEGNDLYYLVKDENIAYHAGISQWTVKEKLRKYLNKYSIGIELQGDGNLVEYTDYQYEVLIWLVKDLMNSYNIPESNILGHEDVAPDRKVDPGKFFDWKRLRTAINLTMVIRPEISSVITETQFLEKEVLTPKKDEQVEEYDVISDETVLEQTVPEKTIIEQTVSLNTDQAESFISEIIEEAETFFMEDSSKTYNIIIRIIKIIISLFKKKDTLL